MVRPGSEVLGELTRNAAIARAHADAAERAARVVRDRIHDLTEERLRTVRELAGMQLPVLDEATVGAAMPEVAADLQRFERQRQQRERELAAELATHEQATATLDQQLRDLTTQLDAVVVRRDDLQRQAAAKLAADPAHPALAEQATQAEVALARDQARAKELAAEAEAKLPPYEQSRLFQYLWKRGFGTPEFAASGLTARLDRWVAEAIDYRRVVGSYRFLKTTPELVRLEVQRRTQEVESLRQRLAAMEAAAEADVGVPAVQAEVDRLVAERQQLVDKLAEGRQRVARVHTTMREETDGRGVFHARALRQLEEMLARTEAATLERRASATPDPRDDQLVAALRACTEALQRSAAESPPLEQEAARTDAIADGLEELVVRFRQADYDAGRSEFYDLELAAPLADVLRGSKPPLELWPFLRNHQRFRPAPVVHHTHRAANVLEGIGLAIQVAGVLADVVGAASGSSRSRSSHGHSSGGGFGSGGSGASIGRTIGGGGDGFRTGRTFGGGGDGFRTGRTF
ncbi:MAG: hypothetical protein U1F60_07140 [Planctomycetota bacterium]